MTERSNAVWEMGVLWVSEIVSYWGVLEARSVMGERVCSELLRSVNCVYKIFPNENSLKNSVLFFTTRVYRTRDLCDIILQRLVNGICLTKIDS